MKPILFELGGLEFASYGLSKALAAVVAGLLLARELRRRRLDPALVYSLIFAGVVGGFAGAKLYYLAEHAGSLTVRDLLCITSAEKHGDRSDTQVLGRARGVRPGERRRGCVARPGQQQHGLNGKRRQLSMRKPALSIAAAVSPFGWQSPPQVGHTSVAAS